MAQQLKESENTCQTPVGILVNNFLKVAEKAAESRELKKDSLGLKKTILKDLQTLSKKEWRLGSKLTKLERTKLGFEDTPVASEVKRVYRRLPKQTADRAVAFLDKYIEAQESVIEAN